MKILCFPPKMILKNEKKGIFWMGVWVGDVKLGWGCWLERWVGKLLN